MTKSNKRDWVNEFDPTDKGRLHYNFQKSDPNIYDEKGEVIGIDDPRSAVGKLSQNEIRELNRKRRGSKRGREARVEKLANEKK